MAHTTEDASLQLNAHARMSAMFLGPHAENLDLLRVLFGDILDSLSQSRNNYYPRDEHAITQQVQASAAFQEQISKLRTELHKLSVKLSQHSVPLWSHRYAAHMVADPSLPATIGWALGMLYNPNNVTFEASPWTTLVEIEVAKQLCVMLGYNVRPDCPLGGEVDMAGRPGQIYSWGHLTCDGTVSILESMVAARNLKFYALALREIMQPGEALDFLRERFMLATIKGEQKPLCHMAKWELLNLSVDTILDIPRKLDHDFGISSEFLTRVLSKFLAPATGKDVLEAKYGIDQRPQYLISSTKHYAWPKSAAISGIGSANLVDIPVDNSARLDLAHLRDALEERLARQQAVYAVVAVVGSTEEGAVDPLPGVLALRDEFAAKGLAFVVHADAAWGGYFASMLPRALPEPSPSPSPSHPPMRAQHFLPSAALSEDTADALRALRYADLITVDPHKTGYVPYAVGGLCYRNEDMRLLMRWDAPYLSKGGVESPALYGVEGSKAGAAATSVFLHHAVVGLHEEGHGRLLAEALFTNRMLSAHIAVLPLEPKEESPFFVVPFDPICPSDSPSAIAARKTFLRSRIVGKSNDEVWADDEAWAVLSSLGSRTNVNCFCINFRYRKDGEWVTNTDVEATNCLNKRVYERLTVSQPTQQTKDVPAFFSSTVFGAKPYGTCLRRWKERLGLECRSDEDLFVLRNVVMSPFQAVPGFARTIVEELEKVIHEEVLNARMHSEIYPQEHCFIMQGIEEIYLVYRSQFHNASSQMQLILRARIEDAAQLQQYQDYRRRNPGKCCFLCTHNKITLLELLDDGNFSANVSADGSVFMQDILISHIEVVKQRPLDLQWRDSDYPALMPFYLYGIPSEMHIDHMLLKAPNVALCFENVKFSCGNGQGDVSAEHLREGLLLWVEDLREEAMQPLDVQRLRTLLSPGASFDTQICVDPTAAVAEGPGLADVATRKPLYTGKMKLLHSPIFVDDEILNARDFCTSSPQSAMPPLSNEAPSSRSKEKQASTREMWSQEVKEYLRR